MRRIGIATDSHCGLPGEEAEKLGIKVLPMPFYFEDVCYYEGVSITREEFFRRLNAGEKVSTSQPSPDAVMKLWREALEECDKLLYMPMSSGLSGSCNTAKMLASENEFKDRVFVVDNGRIATPLRRALYDAVELVEEGYGIERIKEILENDKDKMSIYIAVETLEFLKKGGRISPATAAIGTILNIKPILRVGLGVLESFAKSRGMKKARREMLDAIKYDIEVTFRDYYDRGELYLLAASSADEVTTKEWLAEIKESFPDMDILCSDLSLGVSCHTGEGALGVGCSCKPRR